MQFQTFSHQIRYALFVNQDELYEHETASSKRGHKITHTSFQVFDTYDALIHSQEYALNHLRAKIAEYTEWHELLRVCGNHEDLPELLAEAVEYFSPQKSYHSQKILNTLKKTQTDKKFFRFIIKNFYDAIVDLKNKMAEIEQVYQNLLK